MRIALLAVMLAGPVAAQERVFDASVAEACLESVGVSGAFEDCVGQAAERCMDETDGVQTTAGMSQCLQAEAQWWDTVLNATYGELLAFSKEADAANGAEVPSQETALRDMQRAWIGYRDAKCGFERSQWGRGSGAGPAVAACLMEETAQQARVLKSALPE